MLKRTPGITGAERRLIERAELTRQLFERGVPGLGRLVSPLATDEILGLVGVHRSSPTTVEVAYGVATDQRGPGLATAVRTEVTNYLLTQSEAGAVRVEVVIAPMNHACLRVAAKAGFAEDGDRHGTVPGTGVVYNDILLARELSDPARTR